MNTQILSGHVVDANDVCPMVLVGDNWLDLTTFYDSDEFADFMNELHNNGYVYMSDYNNFPEKYFNNSFIDDELWLWVELCEEEKKICAEYWDEVDDGALIPEILDSLAWNGSFRDYVMELFELKFEAKHEWWMNYFDFGKYERDLCCDYHITTHYIFYA